MVNSNELKILIVDDDEDDYIIIRDLLSEVREFNYQIDWRDSYQAALDALAEKDYDACLLDYRLGRYSGMELLRNRVKIGYRMPIILLTGLDDHEIDVAAMNAGAADFLIKGKVNSVLLERAIRFAIERKKLEEDLYNEKERALVTLDAIGDAVITTDINGRINYLNQMAQKITLWSNDDAQDLPLTAVFKLMHETTRESLPDLVQIALADNRIYDFSEQTLLINHIGQSYVVEGAASSIRDRENRIIGIVIVFRDVTASCEMNRKIIYHASHDSLTGLYNRMKFEERLFEAMEGIANSKLEHCLLYMDLDRFKVVNDTFGHIAGDQLLKEITASIRERIRRTDLFARMGGDEFAVLLENCNSETAVKIANLICNDIKEYRFVWQNYQFSVGISIGIIRITSETTNINRILLNADEACITAKNNGGNGYHLYQGNQDQLSIRENEMLCVLNINLAFTKNLFRLFCQPIAPLDPKSDVLHYELLIRMIDEQGNIIPPKSFLPAATRYKLMSAIDRWVVSNYFAFYKEQLSQNSSLNSFMCNINLSGSFFNEESSLKFLEEQIDRFQISPGRICFEITETSAIDNFEQVVGFIEKLKRLGCYFALDDFGSGLATFNYLKNLPVDFVKIDGSFVRNILNNPVDCAMVDSINQIAHLMQIKTVAEFVENEAICKKLKELGIDYAQGYWIGKPQPLETILKFKK